MGFQSEFAEILQEKMGKGRVQPPQSQGQKSSKPDFPDWKYQFFTSQRSFTPSQIPKQYPRPTPQKTSAIHTVKVEKNKKEEKHFKIGQLGLEYSSDLILLQNLGAEIESDKIQLSSLKKEFRRLAKKFHPDTSRENQTEKIFHSCHQAYSNLSRRLQELNNE